MPADDDDLYDEEYDFVDDADEEEDSEVEEPAERSEIAAEDRDGVDAGDKELADEELADEELDEFGRPEPPPDHVVHIYECKKYKRTIDRAFTAEDAEAFASEYNRTAKPYARFAIVGKEDAKPKKALDAAASVSDD